MSRLESFGARATILSVCILSPFYTRAQTQPTEPELVVRSSARSAPVRLLIGTSALAASDSTGVSDGYRLGTALGLRFRLRQWSSFQLDTDIRLQVAGIRGPCTRIESRERGCQFEESRQSIGDLSLSLGASYQVTNWLGTSAFYSPRLNLRGIDRAVGSTNINWSGSPKSAAVGFDVALWRSARLGFEYRYLGNTEMKTDSQGRATASVMPRSFSGNSFTAAIMIPLRPSWMVERNRLHGNAKTVAPAWTSFGMFVENDLPWRDESYTNGLRAFASEVPYIRNALRLANFGWQKAAPACPYGSGALVAIQTFCRTTQVALTQTMHTPVRIYRKEPQVGDRPFAGTLFISARADLIEPDFDGTRLVLIGSEFQFGVMGPAARSEHTQGLAHWLIATNAARPAGWRNQRGNRLHAMWLLDGAFRNSKMALRAPPGAGCLCKLLNADLTLRGGTALGTTHSFASGGIVFRYSPGADRFPLSVVRTIAPAIAQPKISIAELKSAGDSVDATGRKVGATSKVVATRHLRFALIASFDNRLILHNQTLKSDGIRTHHYLPELGTGFQFEWRSLAMATTILHRGREFSPSGTTLKGFSRYWSTQLSYRPSMP